MAQPILTIQNLTKQFGTGDKAKTVLQNINLTVEEGAFLSLIGPSGCGKSTLLRIIGGLDTAYRGRVQFAGQAVTGPGRERGFIFQDHRLLPWLTVRENIRFSLPADAEDAEDTIARVLSVVNLSQAADAYPGQLSGGMAQRVAIARALANHPRLLLLDEPFGALDAMTRMNLQEVMLKLWQHEGITMILVTHDIDEAVYLGSRVMILDANPGRIRQTIPLVHEEPRSRTSPDFHQQRDRIYHEFFQEQEKPFVYAI